jgi:hypothetical protein
VYTLIDHDRDVQFMWAFQRRKIEGVLHFTRRTLHGECGNLFWNMVSRSIPTLYGETKLPSAGSLNPVLVLYFQFLVEE